MAADRAHGDLDGFRVGLAEAGKPFVRVLRPHHETWAREAQITPGRVGPNQSGDWTAVTQAFRDGHAETWWAADANPDSWSPDDIRHLGVVTADPGTRPTTPPGIWSPTCPGPALARGW